MLAGLLVLLPCALLAFAFALNALWVVILASMLVGVASACSPGIRVPMKDKVVLVTGGSSGIGLAIAKLAAARGARIIIAARNQARLEAAREEILSSCAAHSPDGAVQMSGSAQVSTMQVDLAAPSETVVAALNANPQIAEGRVDFAVLSAGDSGPAAFEDIAPSDWERLLRLNVLGCVHATRAVLPGMKRRRAGRIVLISSMAGRAGIYGFTAYSATKYALRGFADALRMELKPWGVGVTTVLPPDTDTPLLERENVAKPVECRRISEGSGLFSAETVARHTVDAMASGSGVVHFGLDGWMLSHLTVGMEPADSLGWPSTLAGLFLWPVLRIVALAYTALYDHICRQEHMRREKKRPMADEEEAYPGGVLTVNHCDD